jgi:hypothetical protein
MSNCKHYILENLGDGVQCTDCKMNSTDIIFELQKRIKKAKNILKSEYSAKTHSNAFAVECEGRMEQAVDLLEGGDGI